MSSLIQKSRFLLLLCLVFSLISFSRQECEQACTQLSYYTCTLCWSKCTAQNETNYTFSLNTCELRICTRYASEPKDQQDKTNTYTLCHEWQSKLLSQEQCSASCCKPATFTIFTEDNYNQCIQINNDKSSSGNKTTVIIGATLGSVLFVIIVIIIVCCCKQRIAVCFKDCIWPVQKLFIGNKHEKDISKETRQSDQTQKTLKAERKWEIHHKKQKLSELPTFKFIIESQYEINPQIYCSICLDNGLNCKTNCHHSFHFQCLQNYMCEKFVCPECAKTNFNPLKVSCQKCDQKFTNYVFDEANVKIKYPDFYYQGKIYCDTCLDHKLHSAHTGSSSNN